MMKELLAAWLRPACAFLGIAGILVLAGCGGGSGAPNNPYEPPPPPIPDLTIIPGTVTIYPGNPVVLTVYGGVPPYRAFSTDPTVLPVPQNVVGDTIVLNANNVEVLTSVNIGVQDARGVLGRDSNVTIQPSPLLATGIQILGNPNPACSTTDTTVCSGSTGTARVKLTGPGGVGIPNRPVRFDVVQGTFSLVSTNPAQPLVQTLTTVSDLSGQATVILSVPPNTPTQTGILRATDVTTGSSVTAPFVIQQITVNGAVLSILPQGTTTINGPDSTRCSSGVSVNYYIFGGTPPYTVETNFPQAITLTGVPVTTNGGSFTATTNGTCFVNLSFAIRDAVGNVISGSPTITNQLGTGTIPPTPQPFVVTPGAIAKNNCVPANTFQFLGTGGASPYSAVVTSSTSPTSPVISPQTGVAQGQAVTVSGLTSPSSTTITLFDNSSPRQSGTVTIDCTGGPNPPPPSALQVNPSSYNFSTNPGTCVNQTANFVVTGGTPPYTAFFATPRPGAVINPATVPSPGQGFQVTGLTDGVLTTNITVQDSASTPLQTIVTITCPVAGPPPSMVITPGLYTYFGGAACSAAASTFNVTLGTPPYTISFATPGTQGVITPTTVAASGQSFTVTGLAAAPLPRITQMTVQDSSPVPQIQNVSIDCRP